MRSNKHNIVIIEPSDIIVRGLSTILNEANKFCIINTFSDVVKFQEYRFSNQAIDIDIVIINPTLVSFGKRGSIRTILPDTRLIALLYNYIDMETLAQFDESIAIYDKPSKITHKLEESVANNEPGKLGSDIGDLSDREKEILVAVAKGMINKEIADMHNLSVHTVIAHRKNISRKTGIKSASGFAVYALLNNLIEEHEVL